MGKMNKTMGIRHQKHILNGYIPKNSLTQDHDNQHNFSAQILEWENMKHY